MTLAIAVSNEQTTTITVDSESEQTGNVRKRLVAAATAAIGVVASLTGCATNPNDNNGEVAPPAAPGERVATIIFDTNPPKQSLNIYSRVTARRPTDVQRLLPDKIGVLAPESVNTSFKPGLGTEVYSEGRLNAAPELGHLVTISCRVLLDGIETGMTDSVTVDTLNWDDPQEGFAQCIYLDTQHAPAPN